MGVFAVLVRPVERRRAREFARALDSGRSRDRELTPLLATTAAVRRAGAEIPPLRPEFREALRLELLELGAQLSTARAEASASAVADRELRGGRIRRPSTPGPVLITPLRRRAAAVGVALGFVAGAMATTAMAAQAALPGDRLYGVKRTVEDVRLRFAGSEAAKGQLYLSQANRRLTEVSRMLEESGPRPADPKVVDRIADTFDDMRSSTQHGADLLVGAFEQTQDPAPLARLMEFSRSQSEHLRGIAPLLPYEVRPSPDSMLALLHDIATQVTNLSPSSVALPQSSQLLPLGGGVPSARPTGSAGAGSGAGLPAGQGAAQTVLAGGIGGEEPGDASVGFGVEAGEGDGPLPTANASVGVHVPGLPLPEVGVNLLGISLNLGD